MFCKDIGQIAYPQLGWFVFPVHFECELYCERLKRLQLLTLFQASAIVNAVFDKANELKYKIYDDTLRDESSAAP